MSELGASDFAAYFEGIHGVAPFPWQRRLMEKVAADGRWPSLLDLPTGAGKTAALDVALFHLALEAARPPSERTAPLRIVMVVDRRTVVDQAYERAQKIERALRVAERGVLATVAARLRSLSGSDEPLALALLRGGMPRDDAWAGRPDQPLIATSTVDQVGSRLLFRGYGVSDSMKPVHAGLLGEDTLLLLDEVHLSRPFRDTLDAIARMRKGTEPATTRLPSRWQVVAMSATPGDEAPQSFGLSGDDRQDPCLAQRLGAAKPVIALEEVKVSGDEAKRRAAFGRACADQAVRLATPGSVVAVVVNRVLGARAAYEALRTKLGDANVTLLTGRMRPLDRNDLDAKIRPMLAAGRTRSREGSARVIVATQCIEAGADFDFDVLVTECASLDALRQRFGRLNRLGEIDDARAVILARSDALGKDDDPIYGDALKNTWQWLSEQPSLDFGIEALPLPTGGALASLLAPLKEAPILLPAYMDAWAQTQPRPRLEPEVSLFLHGKERPSAPDVQIVWRSDLSEVLLRRALDDEDAAAAVRARVEACPPTALEALSLSVSAARAWLKGGQRQELVDVEGAQLEDANEEDAPGRPFYRYRGEGGEVLPAEGLRPGITVVVPASYGGLESGNWEPEAVEAVSDLGDRARFMQTGRPLLRLLAENLGVAVPTPSSDEAVEDEAVDDVSLATQWLDAFEAEGWAGEAAGALRELGRSRWALVRLAPVRIPGDGDRDSVVPGHFVLAGKRRVRSGHEMTTENDSASYTGVAVPLREHLMGVGDFARQFAERAGLPASLVQALEIAGRWHDAGKVDPRFQRMLHGGSAFNASVAVEPLAKSAMVASNREARLRAQERSGYPKGARHELGSLALLEAWLAKSSLPADVDEALVLHLVASHHGHCRPFAPAVQDSEPVALRFEHEGVGLEVSSAHGYEALDRGVPERFFALVERYGWHGLAWLEAIFRLADHRRSELEQRKGKR